MKAAKQQKGTSRWLLKKKRMRRENSGTPRDSKRAKKASP